MDKIKGFLIPLLVLIFIDAHAQKPEKTPQLIMKGEISRAEFDSIVAADEKPKINFSAAISRFDVKLVSPDGNYVVCYNIEHLYTDYIYFFTKQGSLLAKYLIEFVPTIKFSYTGDFVELFNDVGKMFYIFSKDGEIIKKDNYQNIIKTKKEYMTNVYWDELNDSWLLSTDSHFYCIKDNAVSWKIEGDIRSIKIIKEYGIVLSKKLNWDKKIDDFLMISIKKGNILNEIKEVENYFVHDKNVFILNKNKILKYEME